MGRFAARPPAVLVAALALSALCLAFWLMNQAAILPGSWIWNCGCGFGGIGAGLRCLCAPNFPVGYLTGIAAPIMCIIGLPTLLSSFVFAKAVEILGLKRLR